MLSEPHEITSFVVASVLISHQV